MLRKLSAQWRVLAISVSLLLTATGWSQTPPQENPVARSAHSHALLANHEAQLLQAYHNLPLSFEANLGQTDPRVQFLSRRGPYTLFLTANEAVISSDENPSSTTAPSGSGRSLLTMSWIGASLQPKAEGIDESPSRTNYLIGNNPERWRKDIPNYARVRYHDVYPGVDLLYYSEHGQLEYDLLLSPGARAENIRLKLGGTAKFRLTRTGDLVLKMGRAEVLLHKPVAYQPSASGRDLVAARYVLRGHNQVGFEIGAHDRSRPVVIDPVLTYSSYLGGSANDIYQRIAVDAAGNVYVVGWSASADFPTVGPCQACQPNGRGTTNVIVSKLNPELPGAASLIYSTYLGGSGTSTNTGRGIALDSSNNIYISGDTNALDFPTTTGAYQTSCTQPRPGAACSTDVFAAKLSADGTSLLYSTYIGGTGTEYGFVVAVDSASHMFVGGNTDSADFPVFPNPGAYQTNFLGGQNQPGYGDAFVVELDPTLIGAASLRYASYLGGKGQEAIWGIAVDKLGAVYLAGSTSSSDFPTPRGAYTTFSGQGNDGIGDGFVAKLMPLGQGLQDLVYATYLGGSDDDRVEGIAVDASNPPLVYVTGFTKSGLTKPGVTKFPVTANAFQPAFGGGDCFGQPCADAFIAQLDPSLSGANSLLYSSFFGGSSFDLGHAIALDSNGLVYITGESGSLDLPLLNPIQSQCAAGCTPLPMTDVLIAKFDLTKPGAAGLLFSTYLGGSDVDTGWSIGVDKNGNNAYVAGQIFSTDFPTVIPYQANCNNCTSFSNRSPSGDGFLAKVCFTNCPSVNLSTTSLVFAPRALGTTSAAQSVTVSNSGAGALTFAAISITGANAGDFSQSSNCPVSPSTLAVGANCTINVTFTPSSAGNRTATLVISDNAGSPQSVTLSSGPPDFTLSASLASIVIPAPGNSSAPVMLTISGQNGYNGTILFNQNSCVITPAGSLSTCSFTPSSVTGSGNTQLVITTTAPSGAAMPNSRFDSTRFLLDGRMLQPICVCLLFLVAITAFRKKRPFSLAFGSVILIALFSVWACTGPSGSKTTITPGTPTGVPYTVSINASAQGGSSHTINLTFTVQ